MPKPAGVGAFTEALLSVSSLDLPDGRRTSYHFSQFFKNFLPLFIYFIYSYTIFAALQGSLYMYLIYIINFFIK